MFFMISVDSIFRSKGSKSGQAIIVPTGVLMSLAGDVASRP